MKFIPYFTRTGAIIYTVEEKKFKNVKNRFRVALKCTKTRKSQRCPLRIGCALAKSYGDLFHTPKSLPCCHKKILLIGLLSLLIAKNEAV